MIHWFSNKVFIKVYCCVSEILDAATASHEGGRPARLSSLPQESSVQIIQLNGRVAAAFQMSSGYICPSALIVEWTASNNTVRWVWCLKLDDINITLTTDAGLFCRAGKEYWSATSTFLVFWQRCTELRIGFFPNFKWKVQVLKIHLLFVLFEKKEIDFKHNAIDSSL